LNSEGSEALSARSGRLPTLTRIPFPDDAVRKHAIDVPGEQRAIAIGKIEDVPIRDGIPLEIGVQDTARRK
jgi:hypothetical protein